ncbi:pyridoxal phosphate-dependent transferase [Bisporella sp. PMI_857]|nr:pyridoxal phosphate-dependent transferase [Bisporella sp. PMI_857]
MQSIYPRLRRYSGSFRPLQQNGHFTESVQHVDKTVYTLMEKEKQSQNRLLNLVSSANYCSKGVRDALGTVVQNPNSEGYLGKRYFPGTRFLDDIERLCQQRALNAFGLDDTVWGVNVQAHSRELACLQACSAILHPNDRLLVLGSLQGSNIAKYFSAVTYRQPHPFSKVDCKTVEDMINTYVPRISFANASCLGQIVDYEAIGNTCRAAGVYVVADITENSGLIAAGITASPFEHVDIAVCGTQGSLRGPSGGLIFFRKNAVVPSGSSDRGQEACILGRAVDISVFPMHQGGPHNHTIMAVAVALGQIATQPFKAYQTLVLANAEALGNQLISLGYHLRGSNQKSQHLVVELGTLDIRVLQKVLRSVHVASNIAVAENELHIGTQAMTSRGLLPDDFCQIAEFLHRAFTIAEKIASVRNTKADISAKYKLSPLPLNIKSGWSWSSYESDILALGQEVESWTNRFTMP